MKRAGTVVLLIGGVLYALFGLVWLIMIIMTLFRGDPSIYAEPGYGYLSLALNLVRCLFYLALGALPFFLLGKKPHLPIRFYIYSFAVTAFVLEEIMVALAETQGDTSLIDRFVPLAFAVVYFAGAVLHWFGCRGGAPKETVPDASSAHSGKEAAAKARTIESRKRPKTEKDGRKSGERVFKKK
ncbi:MAG: hypothetical protein LKG11_04420 [Bacilli bacterium]|jgi:phosphate starvation-inducible membrane PsiE|nr:hypothetical protein [Bacilli bacterium]